MVTFEICGGNPGAMTFLMDAYRREPFAAERAFQKMQDAKITGARLYMLWNDCCSQDTELAVRAMNALDPERIEEYINYYGGRGLPMDVREVTAAEKQRRENHRY